MSLRKKKALCYNTIADREATRKHLPQQRCFRNKFAELCGVAMINLDNINNIFSYDAITGNLTWLDRGVDSFKTVGGYRYHVSRFVGTVAGSRSKTKSGNEYIQVNFMGKRYLAHRLIMMIVNGCIPTIVDHIDGDGTNNKLENLRVASSSENARNQRISAANTSGHTGVYKGKVRLWRSMIKVSGVIIWLGEFDDINDAVVARRIAEREHGFSPNHGMAK